MRDCFVASFPSAGQKSTKFHAQVLVHSIAQLDAALPAQLGQALVVTVERSGKCYTSAVALPGMSVLTHSVFATVTFYSLESLISHRASSLADLGTLSADIETAEVRFQETLTFECTLFRDSESADWSEKEYQIAVKLVRASFDLHCRVFLCRTM